MGENGAGKSTLIKILTEFTRKTADRFIGTGQPVEIRKQNRRIETGDRSHLSGT